MSPLKWPHSSLGGILPPPLGNVVLGKCEIDLLYGYGENQPDLREFRKVIEIPLRQGILGIGVRK